MVGRVKYNLVSERELQHMKSRMEQLLIERGIHLDHEEMLKDLAAAGCVVDLENRNLKFTK